jgi:Putative phage tail protein
MSSIGRIALGVVGALILAPVGASAIGFSIGSAIGGFLFAPDGPKTEGPRLGDTNVSASSLGKVLAEHYGVTRVSGNMIWSAGLKEVKRREKQGGGKGGGSAPENTTYTYYCSFSMAMGRGVGREVRRIWADGKLIYDATGESETNNQKYTFRFYSGSNTQVVDNLIGESINRRLAGLPDVNEGSGEQATYTKMADLITAANESDDPRTQLYGAMLEARRDEAETGTGTPNYRFTPAYRQICHIVFDNMPLEDFGNRIPNITAEIVWDGATGNEGQNEDTGDLPRVVDVTEISTQPAPVGVFGADAYTKKLYTVANDVLRRFSLYEKAEELQRTVQTGYSVESILGNLRDGTVVANGKTGVTTPGSGTKAVLFLNPTSLEVIGSSSALLFAGEYPSFGSSVPFSGSIPSGIDTMGGSYFVFVRDGDGIVARIADGLVRNTRTFTFQPSLSGATFNTMGPIISGGELEDGVARLFYTRYDGNTLLIGRLRITSFPLKTGSLGAGGQEVRVTRSAVVRESPFSSAITSISGIMLGSTDDEVVVVANLAGNSTGVTAAEMGKSQEELPSVYDTSLDDAFLYFKTIPYRAPSMASGFTRSNVANSNLCFVDGATLVAIDIRDGSYKTVASGLGTPPSYDAQIYMGNISALLVWEGTDAKLIYYGRAAGDSRDHGLADNVSDVIAAICARAGMSPDEYDVSQVPYAPVRGYTIARPSTGRGVLEVLLQAYFVEGVESDWKIVFKGRTTTPIRTINEEELGEISGPTGKINWLESRTPEFELPAEINLNYSDLLRDYQNGSAHKRRISNPVPAMYSDSVENIEMPLVFKDFEAQDIAERILFLHWMSRDQSKGVFGWTHADLDPGDVVSIRFKDGRIITDRLIKTVMGANFEVEVNSQRSGDPVYVRAPRGTIPTGNVPNKGITAPVDSKMFVFDIPLLYDYHDLNRLSLRYYAAIGSESANWQSATIFRSWDNGTYTNIQQVTVDCTWGVVLGSVGVPRALWSTDVDTVLRVSLGNDTDDVHSVTFEEILNGENRALLWNPDSGIGEIIQFQTVTITDGGVVELSNLQRGLRGTDYAVDKHGANTQFYMLGDAATQVLTNELSRLNTTGYFKGVSTGQLLTGVSSVSIAFRGADLKPWAPSRVQRETVGSDLLVTWNRRTRVGGTWTMSTVETVPLSEDSELYEVYLVLPEDEGLAGFNPDAPSTYAVKATTTIPEITFTAAQLSAAGYTLSDRINVAVYQVSAQVGRGFPALGPLVP